MSQAGKTFLFVNLFPSTGKVTPLLVLSGCYLYFKISIESETTNTTKKNEKLTPSKWILGPLSGRASIIVDEIYLSC